MKFCKCGGVLLPSKDEKGKVSFKCRKCGKTARNVNEEPTIVTREIGVKKGIPVIDSAKETEKLSTIYVICPKCNHDRAIWWMMQTRGADEPATRFFRCVKCGHQWREYA